MSKFYSPERRKQRLKWYSTGAWKRKRAIQLKKQSLCEHCLAEKPRRLVAATVCDHIDPCFENYSGFLSGKTQSLCKNCHRFKTAFFDIPKMVKRERTKMVIIDV